MKTELTLAEEKILKYFRDCGVFEEVKPSNMISYGIMQDFRFDKAMSALKQLYFSTRPENVGSIHDWYRLLMEIE